MFSTGNVPPRTRLAYRGLCDICNKSTPEPTFKFEAMLESFEHEGKNAHVRCLLELRRKYEAAQRKQGVKPRRPTELRY